MGEHDFPARDLPRLRRMRAALVRPGRAAARGKRCRTAR